MTQFSLLFKEGNWWSCYSYLLYRFDPLLFLLRCGGRYPVDHMVPFHHPTISLRLTRFDHLTLVAGVVELKTVLGRKERCLVVGIKVRCNVRLQDCFHTQVPRMHFGLILGGRCHQNRLFDFSRLHFYVNVFFNWWQCQNICVTPKKKNDAMQTQITKIHISSCLSVSLGIKRWHSQASWAHPPLWYWGSPVGWFPVAPCPVTYRPQYT